jgi:hypothetical protein
MTLEAHLEALTRSLAERTIADRPAIRLNEVIAASLPKAVTTYLQAEVLRSLELDLRNGAALRHIDRDSPGMHQLVTSFARSLSYAYTFERASYLPALDDAVHFAANYLFRPRWTLEQFLFEEHPSATVSSMEVRLASVTEYTYLGEILLRILHRRGAAEVPVEEVRTLLAKIDDQVVQQHSPRELANLTRPIFTFMLQGDEATDRPIPVEPLLLFFEDKKMTFLRDYLAGIVDVRRVPGLSFADLATLIEDLYNADARRTAPAGGPPEAVPMAEPVPSAPAPSDMEVTPPEPFPAMTEPAPTEEEPGAPPPEPAASPAPPPAQVNPALSLTFAGMMESRPTGLPVFEELITDHQRKRFVKKIFHRDADYYQTVLAALQEMTGWEQASAYLQEFYRTNELDPFAGDVVEFTDVVQKRFQKGAE